MIIGFPMLNRNKRFRKKYITIPATIEQLEDRILLFSLHGSEWANHDITYSLMPDGTQIGDDVSEMFSTFDTQTAPTEVWQAEIDRAMQTWADAADITITLVADDGSPQGTSGSFGDLRFGAHTMTGLGYAWYPSSSTTGGDIALTTDYTFHVGRTLDLYSVALHEIGHALGLKHSDVTDSVMGSGGFAVHDGLHADDIAGIQAIYNDPNEDGDRFEPNDSISTAVNLGKINNVKEMNLTLHSSTDVDYYKFQPNKNGTYIISIEFSGADLDMTVLDAQGNILKIADSRDDNELVVLKLSNKNQYYVMVKSPVGDTSDYSLNIVKESKGDGKGHGRGGSKGNLEVPRFSFDMVEQPSLARFTDFPDVLDRPAVPVLKLDHFDEISLNKEDNPGSHEWSNSVDELMADPAMLTELLLGTPLEKQNVWN